MTLALRYAAYSDVGLLREGNEDSGYAGPRLLAVADGLGGHKHGEVASSIAITTLSSLDRDFAPDELIGALHDAIFQANAVVQDNIPDPTATDTMGTTLTALLWSGAQVAVGHVGDSRAYMMRNGEFQQITHDHTLIQTLIDEGKITPEEAATHPQRSLLLRALDGRSEVEPDLWMHEAVLGDRYLLCSDGLHGVVSADTMAEVLRTVPDPVEVTRRLVDLANRGGGPDNITCVVSDVVDPRAEQLRTAPEFVGAVANSQPERVMPDTPAGRAAGLGQAPETEMFERGEFGGLQSGGGARTDTAEFPPLILEAADPPRPPRPVDDDDDELPRRPRRFPIMTLVLLVFVALLVVPAYFAWDYIQNQYYIGVNPEGQVTIYRGMDEEVLGYALYTEAEVTDLEVTALPRTQHDRLTSSTIGAASLADAQERVAALTAEAEECAQNPNCDRVEPAEEQGPASGEQDPEPQAS
ncbi:PP2C family protein-serine/threonine phosphatase [Allonocardiopsis opalescens]|uniref:Protein phosphatase n=1 Tax=Allonocardiopsis opalescens TaxID=1144618 RepID=A0A2T0Q6Z0_9ACTN|nr:protein phosphatase 2C domain-containing protein [Allonocardiopsis opalescens]PRX99606.1 protein phosphatase [Allonocardiopsis opalescens]